MSKEIKAAPGIIRTLVPNTDTGEPMMSVTFYLPARYVADFVGLDGREVTLTVPEGQA